jgi:hypothetical protein
MDWRDRARDTGAAGIALLPHTRPGEGLELEGIGDTPTVGFGFFHGNALTIAAVIDWSHDTGGGIVFFMLKLSHYRSNTEFDKQFPFRYASKVWRVESSTPVLPLLVC